MELRLALGGERWSIGLGEWPLPLGSGWCASESGCPLGSERWSIGIGIGKWPLPLGSGQAVCIGNGGATELENDPCPSAAGGWALELGLPPRRRTVEHRNWRMAPAPRQRVVCIGTGLPLGSEQWNSETGVGTCGLWVLSLCIQGVLAQLWHHLALAVAHLSLV